MDSPWLRIEVKADDDAPFIAMFEPSGSRCSPDQRESSSSMALMPRQMQIIYGTVASGYWL